MPDFELGRNRRKVFGISINFMPSGHQTRGEVCLRFMNYSLKGKLGVGLNLQEGKLTVNPLRKENIYANILT